MNSFARLLAVPLLVAACTAASPTPNASVNGRVFLSTGVTDGGQPHALVPGTRLRLAFSDGNLSISTGCNTMGGTYRIADGVLLVGDLSMTEMACQPDLMAQDEWIGAFIGARPTVTLAGNELKLQAGDTVVTLLDREVAEPDQALVGPTWTLVSLISQDTASSVPGNVVATLSFTAGGRVDVNDGCNTGGGPYTVEADAIHFGAIATTLIGCSGAQAQVESAMLAVLGAGAVSYRIEASTLTLLLADSGLQFQGS